MRKEFLVALTILSLNAYAQPNQLKLTKGIKKQHILFDADMKQGVTCYRIPAMVTAVNGDIICAIDERVPSCADLNGSRDINIVMRRSKNNGRTFTPIKTIVDLPDGESASDPSMIVDKQTGDIFLFYNYMNHNDNKKTYRFFVIQSSDNGVSWGKATDITSQISKAEWEDDFKFITSGRGIQTQSGTMLHCLVNLQNGGHVFGSKNHGKTWFLIDTKITPFNESKILELSNGNWLINSRVQGQGYRTVHVSYDKGKSWKSHIDSSLVDPACNASIIRYISKKHKVADKILIFANNNNKTKRKNMSIRISRDDGKTWSKGKTLYSGSSAYATLTVLQNGDIALLFEADDYKKNVFVSFPLSWIEN